MKLWNCASCGQLLHFENTRCEGCGHRLGYVPDADRMVALKPTAEDRVWTTLGPEPRSVRFCENAQFDVCNWLISAEAPDLLCMACRHNRTIPDISEPETLAAWGKMEVAKHRLFYSLLRLGLPRPARGQAPEPLVFDVLADAPTPDGPKVMTGHDNGLITIALAEADDAERERRRGQMREPYRTLLGHFRHEIGHFYWDRLVRDGGRLPECRAVFGNDEEDYAQALKRHYDQGAPADWRESFISEYATTHPWEDFAETWAHYLHIVDALEMANALGLEVNPHAAPDGVLSARVDLDVYAEPDMGRIVATWIPLTFALNAMNRCMGLADLYPFVLSRPVIRKLGFIHDLVRGHADS